MTNSIVYISAAVSVFTGVAAGLGICYAIGKATDAIARQPEMADKITTVLLIGGAMAEATAVYGFVVALMMLFV